MRSAVLRSGLGSWQVGDYHSISRMVLNIYSYYEYYVCTGAVVRVAILKLAFINPVVFCIIIQRYQARIGNQIRVASAPRGDT